MNEFRARRVVDSLRDRGVNAAEWGQIMTPQQKALIIELRAADYPATWKLSATAADNKLLASGISCQPPGARTRRWFSRREPALS